MTQLTRSTKVALMVGAVLVLLIPLGIAAYRYPPFLRFVQSLFGAPNSVISQKYKVESIVPDYDLRLVDTAYLEWLTTKLQLFNDQGVIDPIYHIDKSSLNRRTITSITLRLVEHVNFPLTSLMPEMRPFEPVRRTGSAEYAIEGDTLIISVYLNVADIAKDKNFGKDELGQKFIQLVSMIMYNASFKEKDSVGSARDIDIVRDIRDYLQGNIFPWPFVVEEKL